MNKFDHWLLDLADFPGWVVRPLPKLGRFIFRPFLFTLLLPAVAFLCIASVAVDLWSDS